MKVLNPSAFPWHLRYRVWALDWWLALVGGLLLAADGVVIAYTRFFDVELTLDMVADGLVIGWMIALAMLALSRSSVWHLAENV